MKNVVFIIVLIAILGGGYLFFIQFKDPGKSISITNMENVTLNIVEENDEKNEYDPISIPAFSVKDFNGHDFKMGEVLDRSSAYTRYFISYESGEFTISGIMNVPEGKGPFPVLFLNHGYIDPEIYTNGRGLKREQDYLAHRGYVVVHSDYRNHAQSDREANLLSPDLRFGFSEDVINAVLSLEKAELPFVDMDRIGMLGHSMGGGVAEIIAVSRPELVDAFVLFAPVSADQKDNYEKWVKRDEERDRLTIERLGSPEDNPELWKNASPINFFKKMNAPIIFHHGINDKDVPLEWSERAVEAIKRAGKDITLYTYLGEGHEFAAAWPIVMQRTVEFFDKHVKNKKK